MFKLLVVKVFPIQAMRKKSIFTELTNIAKNVMSSIKEHTLKLCQSDYIWPTPRERVDWEYILKGVEMCIGLTKKIFHQEFILGK